MFNPNAGYCWPHWPCCFSMRDGPAREGLSGDSLGTPGRIELAATEPRLAKTPTCILALRQYVGRSAPPRPRRAEGCRRAQGAGRQSAGGLAS